MARVKTGLSRKLLLRVLSFYFILTLVVTVGQIFAEYLSTKNNIEDELQTLKNTFSDSLTRALWELNLDQASAIGEGLMEIPIVEGVQIRDENGDFIARFGIGETLAPLDTMTTDGRYVDVTGTAFGYTFPLVFEFSGRTSEVGDVTLYSNFEIIFGRIQIGVYFLIGNAIVKTTFLLFLFMSAFRKMLSEPLDKISKQMYEFDSSDLEGSKIDLWVEDDNELRQLTESYNNVISDLIQSQTKLHGMQDELQTANKKLDDQNLVLEQEVAKKTASLSQIMLDLEQQKDELLTNQRELRQENENRQYIEAELRRKNKELASSNDTLNLARDQLLESERMASLGGLVAGIAHDVNTPIGVSVTAASFLEQRLQILDKDFQAKTLTNKAMHEFIDEARQTSQLLMNNLHRASELIASFKQVAVDQTSEAERRFTLNEYIQEILQSLNPSIKKYPHTIEVSCPPDLEVYCAPGVIAQIVTNLLMNSMIHAFEEGQTGEITLTITEDGTDVLMQYRDNGKGLDEDSLARLFDAFFTTRRQEGGTGLGTHILFNLVTQALQGNIDATSAPGQGLSYSISFPKRV